MNRAILLLLISSLLWSTGGLLIKWVDWNPLAIAGVRSAIAAVAVWCLIPRPQFHCTRVQLAGAFAYAITVVLFVIANKLTTAANAIFLQFTAPIYIALFGAWFLKEHPSRLDWALIVLAQLGTAMFFLDGLTLKGMWGNLCALASGVGFAAVTLLLRKQKDASPGESILLGNLFTAVICLPFMFDRMPSGQSWLGLAILGVVQLGIPYALYAHAIKNVKALEAVLIGTLEPVLNPLWVLLFIGEKPQPWALAGGALVIAAATVRGVLTARNAATQIHPPE
jgi:drug/metabolite transporter (DMT)-like permease